MAKRDDTRDYWKQLVFKKTSLRFLVEKANPQGGACLAAKDALRADYIYQCIFYEGQYWEPKY